MTVTTGPTCSLSSIITTTGTYKVLSQCGLLYMVHACSKPPTCHLMYGVHAAKGWPSHMRARVYAHTYTNVSA
jgi:hypothetical protein